jgi:hypothetical protein
VKLFGHTLKEKDWIVIGGAGAAIAAAAALAQLSGKKTGTAADYSSPFDTSIGGSGDAAGQGTGPTDIGPGTGNGFVFDSEPGTGSTPDASPTPTASHDAPPAAGPPLPGQPGFVMPQIFQPPTETAIIYPPHQDFFAPTTAPARTAAPALPGSSGFVMPTIFQPPAAISGPIQSPDAAERNALYAAVGQPIYTGSQIQGGDAIYRNLSYAGTSIGGGGAPGGDTTGPVLSA